MCVLMSALMLLVMVHELAGKRWVVGFEVQLGQQISLDLIGYFPDSGNWENPLPAFNV